jgi:uncharacterized protein (DUF2252 family)
MNAKTIEPYGRDAVLDARRRLKMAESANAYVRGNAITFYEWLTSVEPTHLILEGPPIWICGDCHIVNPGGVATPRVPYDRASGDSRASQFSR